MLRFLTRIDRFILSPIYVLIKMVCLHVFFQAEKENKGGITWSEVNRNGLHSLEVSLY